MYCVRTGSHVVGTERDHPLGQQSHVFFGECVQNKELRRTPTYHHSYVEDSYSAWNAPLPPGWFP